MEPGVVRMRQEGARGSQEELGEARSGLGYDIKQEELGAWS